ncbi:ABC transporter substrate-binding protein [Arthrobacter psychrochitiniphilus]|uniref:ABC transporter substrate-binding protein n=1 Tax=Arthrobacter psychrochitiniphilus TaxID=291045 RepID=A0A2V3DQX0_9MICC|nr:ABC transporter substrate-binding protein [Arthrobacter psychrochitiniphilus]NYG17593.1 iron(III) transport system substrate-binding protein [Arthrobacter psychrochitiniphilus]PXA64686.1 ABC transporter substrate-binding protein [Arthrobacter psychrochitiniphilus]
MFRSSPLNSGSVSRRQALGFGVLGAATLAAALTGCGSTNADKPAANAVPEGFPSYYPADYSKIVDASKAEGGKLTIYSNTDQENWAPILRDFKAKYPWTQVSADNLDSDEVFQRQLSEMATGKAPADMLVSNAVQAWASYGEKSDTLMEYDSPETKQLPDYAQLMPNVWAMSLDPVGIAYNTALMKEAPTSIAGLAKTVTADAAGYKNKITTRDVKGAWGFTVSHAFAEGSSDAWTGLDEILPSARPESSSGTQKEKILSGEYVAGFFISSAVGYPAEKASGGLVKFVLPTDGTVVLGRGIGITPKAPHPATAKLFLDFVLSETGQNAVAEGGLSSYRDNVELSEGRHTYQEVEKLAGKDGIIRVPYTMVPDAEVTAFVSKWNAQLGS